MKKWIVCLIVLFVVSTISIETNAAGASYAVIDAENGRLLLGENEHAALPIASLTKIWTALIVLERSELTDLVYVSSRAALTEGSSIYLEQGQTYTIDYLVHGLMMQSGNDAAIALAEHVGGSVEGFVHLMNEKAQAYQLTQTNFTNPTGLHHEKHLSSAYDTAKMLQIAMQHEGFQKVASTKVFSEGMTWKNKHRLLHEDVGAIAGKTGYTKVASRTLATFFKREQKSFIVVTLNEGNDWYIHKELADYVEAHFEHEIIVKKGTYKVNGITVFVDRPIVLLMKKGEKPELQHILVVSRHPDSNRAAWRVYEEGVLVASKLMTVTAR